MDSTMTEPKLWRDMTPEEKGALLLAHHEGKAIQMCYGGNRWGIATPSWDDSVSYRVKPPEPRVWWMVIDKWGDVYCVCDTKKTAEDCTVSGNTRSIVRVVECPDG